MPSQSLSGLKYFMTFIDNYSRQTWCYFLKAKSQDSETFRQFKALVENEARKTIKTLRLDKEGGGILRKNLKNS